MSQTQKYAWFNLTIVAVTVVTIGGLAPLIGYRAWGGLGFLGFLGLGPIFFRKWNSRVVADERDVVIQLRSMLFAYSAFWVAFVVAAVFLAPLWFEDRVPTPVVQISVAVAWMLVTTMQAAAILVQYGRGGNADAV